MKVKLVGLTVIIFFLFSCKENFTGYYRTFDEYSQTKNFELTLYSNGSFYFQDTVENIYSEGKYSVNGKKIILSCIPYKKISITVVPTIDNKIPKDSILVMISDSSTLNNIIVKFSDTSYCIINNFEYLVRPLELSYIQLYSSLPDLISNKVIINSNNFNKFIITDNYNSKKKYITLCNQEYYIEKYQYIKMDSCDCTDTIAIIAKDQIQRGLAKYKRIGDAQ
jgi:hypothetical protein